MKHICSSILSIAPHIKQALNNFKPVVALQSTIISHGMPYPQNKQCAMSIENQVKKFGAIPATIAIIDGKITVGLTQNQIQRLAYEGTKVKKVSRRDLPYILMSKQLGATTVSSTMIAAQLAGIDIFVTGGIGGVHRGYQNTLDASADLRELGQTPVTVISAGVKSILDISRTLEYLETQGVPVITYNSPYFPAFFSSSSGIKSPSTLNSTIDIAKLLFEKQKLNLRNGVLVAVPNNNPAQGEVIQKAIQQALKQANEQGIKGAQITPFLLKRVNELTKGKSLASNISLVHNNAQIGSKIAVDLCLLKEQSRKKFYMNKGSTKNNQQPVKNIFQGNQIYYKKQQTTNNNKQTNKVIIIGASAIDSQYRPMKGQNFELYKSCRGFSTKRMGGVGRNIAQVCARLNTPTTLITPLGNDSSSQMISQFCKNLKIDLRQIHSSKYKAAEYLTVMDGHNDEMIGISQMQINSCLSFENIYNTFFKIEIQNKKVNSNDIVIIDANVNHDEINLSDLKKLLGFLNQLGYFVVYQCKGKKTKKIADTELLKYVSLLRMNAVEYQQLFKVFSQRGKSIDPSLQDKFLIDLIGKEKKNNQITELIDACSLITNKSQKIKLLLKNGDKRMVQVKPCDNVIKSTGAGDSLTGTLVSLLSRGKKVNECLEYALIASRLSLQTVNEQSVISNQISFERIDLEVQKSRN